MARLAQWDRKTKNAIWKYRPHIPHESAAQADVITWANFESKRRPELALLFAIPNGHGTHIVTRLKMVREGLKSGVPDLCLPIPRQKYHALYIEMKFGKNKLTQAQEDFIALLEAQGNKVDVAYSALSAKNYILDYLNLEGTP